jgi:hypothetical protein
MCAAQETQGRGKRKRLSPGYMSFEVLRAYIPSSSKVISEESPIFNLLYFPLKIGFSQN